MEISLTFDKIHEIFISNKSRECHKPSIQVQSRKIYIYIHKDN